MLPRVRRACEIYGVMIRIPSSGQFWDEVERRRQPGASRASTKAVAEAAREFAVLAAPVLEDVLVMSEHHRDRPLSNADTMRDICIDLALMAEDLLSSGFLWRVIERNNRRLFGSPLPLVIPAGAGGGAAARGGALSTAATTNTSNTSGVTGVADVMCAMEKAVSPVTIAPSATALQNNAAQTAPLPALDRGEESLDARRFQFFLFTVFSYWAPGIRVVPDDDMFVELAGMAARFFRRLRGSAVSPGDFLTRRDSAHDDIDGAGMKRKLVWLGCASYLLCAAFKSYRTRDARQSRGKREFGGRGEGREIAATDDFLCQECTQWSGLGALEILADALRLEGQDREDLLGWSERHTAAYHMESVSEFTHPKAPGVPAVSLEATNVVNRQRYKVLMFGMTPRECLFKAGEYVYGMLARWRGVWRWMGVQERLSDKLDEAEVRKSFITGSPGIVYRYCPDLLAKARVAEARSRESFMS